MSNPLTGDFEAVVQIAVRQIDGLLAMLHQYGDDTTAPLKLLHSERLRVGHERRLPDLEGLGDWISTANQALAVADGPRFRAELIDAAPAGAARLLTAAFAGLDNLVEITEVPVRGVASVQMSNVLVEFAPGATSEVMLRVRVRARYEPEPQTEVLAAPIHGAVRAAFTVRPRRLGAVTRLEIRPSADDSKIVFEPDPASGVDAAQAASISRALRRVIRSGVRLLPIELPASFPFSQFRAIGSGFGQTLALPLSLSGNPVAGNIDSLTTSHLAGHGFAVAVGADFVRSLIDLEAIRAAVNSRQFTLRLSRFGVGVSVTYKLHFTSGPTITFAPGAIEVSGRVAATTGTWWAPNGFVSFRQRLGLTLDEATQTVRLEKLGSPSVDESWFIPHGRAQSIVETEIDKAVAANGPGVRRIFTDTRNRFLDGLRNFDRGATVTFATVEITRDGVVVRGEIGSTAARLPVVRIGETEGGATLTAFESWIPGGSLDRFLWSWVEYPAHLPTVFSGVLRTAVETHKYTFPRPEGLLASSAVCLRIMGTRVLPSGFALPVAAGTMCEPPEPELELAIPSWWEPLTIPVWPPDLAPDATLADAVVAHVSVQSDRPGATDPVRNTLVCFVDFASDADAAAIAAVVSRLGRRRRSLAVLLVVPPGRLTTRREVEARLAPLAGVTAQPAQITEDHDGGWTRTFDVKRRPAWFLVNARREVAWSQQGDASPEAMAPAIDRLLLPTPGLRRRSLRLAVRPGDPAPDVVVDDERGARFALHRRRGEATALVFWQAWSTPSVAELLRLQQLRGDRRDGVPAVIGVHGAAAPDGLDVLGKRLGITVPLVADPEHRVARRYGVRSWPTTVYVDEEMRVAGVEIGARERDRLAMEPVEAPPAE